MNNNYYISSFAWSTISKILNAILGFISVPLLLAYYGKVEYGLLSIATACNGYMNLLDLGMNTGAVKFYAQWNTEGDKDKIYRVARTNISFYMVVAGLNILFLIILALYGEPIFSISHDEFLQLGYAFIYLRYFVF